MSKRKTIVNWYLVDLETKCREWEWLTVDLLIEAGDKRGQRELVSFIYRAYYTLRKLGYIKEEEKAQATQS